MIQLLTSCLLTCVFPKTVASTSSNKMTTFLIFADLLFDRNRNNPKCCILKSKGVQHPQPQKKEKCKQRPLRYSLLSASPGQGTHHHTEPTRSAQGHVEAPPVRHEAHVSAAIGTHQTQDDDFTLAAYPGAMATVHEDLALTLMRRCFVDMQLESFLTNRGLPVPIHDCVLCMAPY